MTKEFFVRFHDMSETKMLMELSAESPSLLLRKIINNREAICNLNFDHHTTNLKNKYDELKEDE